MSRVYADTNSTYITIAGNAPYNVNADWDHPDNLPFPSWLVKQVIGNVTSNILMLRGQKNTWGDLPTFSTAANGDCWYVKNDDGLGHAAGLWAAFTGETDWQYLGNPISTADFVARSNHGGDYFPYYDPTDTNNPAITMALDDVLQDLRHRITVSSVQGNKADKVQPVIAGHFAGLDSTGNLTDSGLEPDDVVKKQRILTINTTGDNLENTIKGMRKFLTGVTTINITSDQTSGSWSGNPFFTGFLGDGVIIINGNNHIVDGTPLYAISTRVTINDLTLRVGSLTGDVVIARGAKSLILNNITTQGAGTGRLVFEDCDYIEFNNCVTTIPDGFYFNNNSSALFYGASTNIAKVATGYISHVGISSTVPNTLVATMYQNAGWISDNRANHSNSTFLYGSPSATDGNIAVFSRATESFIDGGIKPSDLATNTALTTHTNNANIHVTSSDKTNWNNKVTRPSTSAVDNIMTMTATGDGKNSGIRMAYYSTEAAALAASTADATLYAFYPVT